MKPTIFKQSKVRGLVYAFIALAGILYEFFFAKEKRPFLIAAYSLVIFVGIFYYLRSSE
jgi:predicted membrane channel-forming protein YqfA (hemolysin III family)